ncbi:MAG: 6-phosphogluconolactonase [Steroidobacteraceae bacterium]
MILQRFETADAASGALASQVIAALRMGLGWRQSASLAVAGGRTPVALFRLLSEAELDWSRVGVTLTDERWVAEDQPGSNGALVRATLLAGRAGAARFVPLFDGQPLAGATQAAWERVRELPLPFDAVVLGMGEDGHFASLFPGNANLPAALDAATAPGCVAMRAPVAPGERISLNLAALLQTRRLFLQVTGAAKLELLLAAARAEGTQWPVTTLLAQRHPEPEIFWAP